MTFKGKEFTSKEAIKAVERFARGLTVGKDRARTSIILSTDPPLSWGT